MQPKRNDPCPCGSGKKYMRCCGATILSTIPVVASDTSIGRFSLKRQCGTCTACCDGWLRINIRGQDIYPGNPCRYSTGDSCNIYENRPEACRKFICGWFEEGSPLPENFRPDKIGVIFVIATWRGAPIYVLTPAGKDPDGELLEWMKKLSLDFRRPFIYQLGDEWYAFGSPEFQNEILSKIARGEKLW